MIRAQTPAPVAAPPPGLHPGDAAAAIRAIGTADFFPALRAMVRAQVHIDNLVAVAFARDRGPLILHQWSPQEPNYFQLLYGKGAYQLDPFYLASLDPRRMGAHRLSDIAPDSFATSDYHRSYYQKVEIIDEIGLLHAMDDRAVLHLSLGRRTNSAPYCRADLGLLRHLEPALSAMLKQHCARAVEVWADRSAAVPPAAGATRTWLAAFGVTVREAEIADLVLRGHSNGSAGAVLGISAETVKVHRKNLYAKLRISSQSELYMMFIDRMLPKG